jgi:hypothetical protein
MSQGSNDKRSHSQIFLDNTTRNYKIATPALLGFNAGVAIFKKPDSCSFPLGSIVPSEIE